MVGFRLKAITKKGRDAIMKFQVGDRRCRVVKLSDDPLELSFILTPRFGLSQMMMAVPWFVPQTLKGYDCKEGVDYEFEVMKD